MVEYVSSFDRGVKFVAADADDRHASVNLVYDRICISRCVGRLRTEQSLIVHTGKSEANNN